MHALKRICFVITALFLGCSGGETPTPSPSEDAGTNGSCKIPFLGDPAAEPEIELMSLGPDNMFVPITNGGSVALIAPPAAGFVVFACARVRNMNPCAIRIDGRLEDPVSEQVRIDNRLANFEPTGDGWGQSADFAACSNLAVCPNSWSMQDLFGKEYELTVAVTDRDGRKVTQSLRIVPTCDDPGKEALCSCLCKQGYELGQQCLSGSDGGP